MADIPNPFDFWFWPLRLSAGLVAAAPEAPQDWTSPNEVVATLPTMRLRRFGPTASDGAPVLVVAPFAVHDARIADIAPGHSLIGALAAGGVGPLFLTEWRSATPEMRELSIDSYLSDLNAAFDLVGRRPAAVGLCQGGWMTLLHAAAFPGKLRRIVIAGAPVDVAAPSPISAMARLLTDDALEALVAMAGGTVSGALLQSALQSLADPAAEARAALQADAPPDVLERFAAWDACPLDLPGRYYAQVVAWLFRDNRLARGSFPAFGRPVALAAVQAPFLALAGAVDAVAPPQQVLAALDLIGTGSVDRVGMQADCGHAALFMGARTLTKEWREIAAWLRA